jgi:hypothetical protein
MKVPLTIKYAASIATATILVTDSIPLCLGILLTCEKEPSGLLSIANTPFGLSAIYMN